MTSHPLHELWRTAPAAAALFCSAGLLLTPPLHAQAPPAAPPAATPPAPTPPAAPAAAPAAPAAATPAPAPPAAPAQAAPLDQGPDTLPPLEGSPEVVEPPPSVAVVAVGPVRAALPVRAERRLALLGELSWNGIAGFGPILTFHAFPQLSIDLGTGLALVGWKLGLRTRYNFLKSEVTPFVGLGFLAASGFDSPPSQNPPSENGNPELNIKLRPSAFLQATVGLDYTDSDGFTFLGALGYAWLVSNDNVVIVTGEPTPEEQRALDVIFGSSVVISIGIGYSFR